MKADKENEKVSQTGKVLWDILYYLITVETLNIWLVKNTKTFTKWQLLQALKERGESDCEHWNGKQKSNFCG